MVQVRLYSKVTLIWYGGFSMANLQKYTKSATGHLTKHFERAKDINGDYIKFGNQDIDTEKSDLNYNLAPEHNQIDFIRQRCSEVQCLNRKDVNVMCSWVVTAPKNLDQAEEKAFFKHTYDFLANRYGEKNVISAYVHLDEKSPHMHFAFVPVALDKNKGIEKVSAKEVITRNDLQSFHTDLEKHLERTLGHEVDILNEATKEGNKSIDELKKGTAIKEVAEIKQKVSKIVSKAQEEAKAIKDSIIPLEAEYNAYKAYLDQAKRDSDVSVMYPQYAEVSKKGLIHKQEYVTVPKEMWEAKHVSANEIHALERLRNEIEGRIKEFKKSSSGERMKTLEGELKKSKGVNQQLSKALNEANTKLQKIADIFRSKPELARAVSQAEKELKKTKMHSMDRGR